MGAPKLQNFDLSLELTEEQKSAGASIDARNQFVINRIETFIDGLSGLNELDKYWARTDALQALKESEDLLETVGKLEKKYSFYNTAGELRNDICKKAPDGNGNTVCNLIDTSILSISSDGKDRSWKLEELKTIKKSIDLWKNEQDITQFVQRQQEVSDTVIAKILMLFDSEFAEKFEQFQLEMGTPKFWMFTKKMSPAEFPNFTTTFNFQTPRDFLKNITRKNLHQWPKRLRQALTKDAEEILSSEVFDSNREQKLSSIKSSKTLARFVSRLLELKYFRDTERLKIDREKEIQKRNQEKEEKQKVLEREEQANEEKMTLEKEEQSTQEKKIKEKKKKDEDKKKEKTEDKIDLGGEKQKILEFYDKSIEHTQKVIEECPNWGVRPDDIDYWGQEGVKNRMSVLKKRNTWNDYVRFNSSDKYIPSNARGDGFRFRWLNVNTGSRISAAGADSGIKYMQRYKESGYQLCVLAGAFSVDWAGSDSTVDTPVRFLEKMQSLRNHLIGTVIKK